MEQETKICREDYWQERFLKLSAFCRAIEWRPEAGSFYDGLAGLVLEQTGCDAVVLREFTVTECRTIGAAFVEKEAGAHIRAEFASTPVTVGLMADMMKDPEPIYIEFEHPKAGDDPEQYRMAAAFGFHSSLIVKLIRGNELYGDMVVSSRVPDAFDSDTVQYLETLAQMVSSFIDFHRISEQQMEASILNECRRLMTEVRANQMNYLNAIRLEGEQALSALWDGDRQNLEKQLRLIAKTSRAAVDSLRDDMVMPFDVSGETKPVVEQMAQLLERFEYMWSVSTHLRATKEARRAMLGPSAVQQVIRMAHEALSNINRHAHAQNVFVELDAQENQLVIRIKDDGVGFDIGELEGASIGLKAMRERMTMAQGTLTIESSPGKGTIVVALVPVASL